MNRLLKGFCTICLVLPINGFATTGWEGFSIAPSFYFSSVKTTDNDMNTKVEQTNMIMSTRVGWTMNGGFYVGGIYESKILDDGSDEFKSKNIGASIGFTESGSFIVYHHLFNVSSEVSSNTEYTGKGSGFDFGHHFQLNEMFSLGAQLSIRSYDFDESDVSGTNSKINIEKSTTIPMLSLGITF